MPKEIIEGKGPIYDPSDDPDGDEFVKANDPEPKKFKIDNEIPSGARDFSNSINVSRRARLVKEADELLEEDDKNLKDVRQDIGKYKYHQKGSENSNLASFHVNHDNREVTAVYENAVDIQGNENEKIVDELETVERSDPESIKDAPSEEEFAKLGIAQDRKINSKFIPYAESRAYAKDEYSNKSDNLKTRPLRKRLRDTRGEIRDYLHEGEELKDNRSSLKKFIDSIWNKN